jgi:radical SAM superfamily enzyme YgiQ (UPF0313 family)
MVVLENIKERSVGELKILLINPLWMRLFGLPVFTFPPGLCYIAAVLEDHGFDVLVYDMDITKGKSKAVLGGDNPLNDEVYSEYIRILDDLDHPLWNEVATVISRQSPDIVGISAMSGQYGSALNIAKLAKEFDPDISVVMGGAHPTALPEETVKNEDVDIVARGEGEYTFLDLVEKIESNGQLKDVLGITYKEKDKVINNPDRPLIRNLDDLPFPAKHLILGSEDSPPGFFSRIVSSRGCPYNCIFCGSRRMWGNKVRYRSPENVVEEIKYVHKTFVTPSFCFGDADFLLNKKFVSELCDLLIEEGLIINWYCNARVDEVDGNIVSKMALAGCQRIEIGVESGSDETLKRAKKGITTEQIKESRRILRGNFIVYDANCMIGFPWETKEDVEETLSFMEKLDPDYGRMFVVTPYPGTEMYEMYKDKTKEMDWRYYLIQRPEFCINKNLTKEDFSQIIESAEKEFRKRLRLKTRGVLG